MNSPPDTDPMLATAKIWRLASRTFSAEVDKPFYRALLGLAAAPRLQAMGLAPIDPDETTDHEQALSILAAEYCRLFIGPGPICPPYASLQKGGAHLGGHALRRIDAFMDEHHLAVHLPEGAPILAHDHVAVAFALLDQLYRTAAGQTITHLPPHQAAVAAQDLLDNYLLHWIPQFLRDVENAAQHTVYRNLSRLAALVLADTSTRPPEGAHCVLTVYSTPTCGYCHRLKSQLDREGIPYTDINIEQDPDAAAYVASVNGGNHTVPTVRCPDGSTMTNPTIHQLRECLLLHR